MRNQNIRLVPDFIEHNPLTDRLPLAVRSQLEAWVDNLETVVSVKNLRVMGRMAPSAIRGLFLQVGRRGQAEMRAHHRVHFDFDYPQDNDQMRGLYEKAKLMQWNASTDLDWSTSVDPLNPEVPLLSEDFIGWDALAAAGIRLDPNQRAEQLHGLASWMLSQFLHGEHGALMAAAQVTEAIPGFDGKLYGASQVMDEARHVEVFNRYLTEKLQKRYDINDNLFTIIDSLMTDGRWDMKFLGMQILVEGLALGAFGTLYKMTREPLLREMLRRVIHDEARHVRYGLLALKTLYTEQLSEKERREREDWAFEVVLLMRNRFLAHEIYDENFAGQITRRAWNHVTEVSPGMTIFRHVMFQRLVPNLKAIGLLTPRIRARYAEVGLDRYFGWRPTSELGDADLLGGGAALQRKIKDNPEASFSRGNSTIAR